MLRPFELSPEPGSLSNPLPPDRTCFPCDPEWKCPPSLCRQRVKCGRTGPYWAPVAPHDSHMKSCTAAAQVHWRAGWRPRVADHIVASCSCASDKCLPTSLTVSELLRGSADECHASRVHHETRKALGAPSSPRCLYLRPISHR